MAHYPTRQRYLVRQQRYLAKQQRNPARRQRNPTRLRSSERLQILDSHKPFLEVKTFSCHCCWLADPGTLALLVQYLPKLQPLTTNVGRVV